MTGRRDGTPAAGATCAIVAAPLAHLYARPDHRAELRSQRLHGEVLRIHARDGAWCLAAGFDGYAGWIRSWSLVSTTARAGAAWAAAARAVAWRPLVPVHAAPASDAAVIARLPWGARLVPLAGTRVAGGFRAVLLPGGGGGFVPARALGPRWRAAPGLAGGAARGRRAAALALAQRGTGYLWGGASSLGFDCSGLVQWAYALCGLALPRDARDQIRVARPLAGDERARPGDLLFFGRAGDVNHVALFTAPPRFVHAYGRVEEAVLSGPGSDARPELRAIFLGVRRPG
jgi:cell wall-associated NlpC family hydrolase